MKKIGSFLLTFFMVFMLSVSTVNASAYLDTSNLGPTSSLQLMFAKLQLELSETAKTQALERMEHIAQIQEEQKLVASYLNKARELQAEAKNASGGQSTMPSDMAQYMDSNGLSYDKEGNDLLMTSEEWNAAIKSLEAQLEKLGAETQQQMVYVQDFMGQYNSYLQGANTQINNSNQTLTNLARGQTMYTEGTLDTSSLGTASQSMYGAYSSGLTVTTLVVGVVLGCLLTLFVQKVSKGKIKS